MSHYRKTSMLHSYVLLELYQYNTIPIRQKTQQNDWIKIQT